MKKSLVALAAGTFALGIAEFVMMGMLPDVATDLGVSIPVAGHFIAAYALGVCAGAPLLVLTARTRPLKQILLGLAALIALGNLCTAFAPEYWFMLATRFLSGLPHGAFFGVGSIVADKLSDRGKVAQAIAIMTAGRIRSLKDRVGTRYFRLWLISLKCKVPPRTNSANGEVASENAAIGVTMLSGT